MTPVLSCEDADHAARNGSGPARHYLRYDDECPGGRLVVLCAPCAEDLSGCGIGLKALSTRAGSTLEKARAGKLISMAEMRKRVLGR